jgi:hypothetical protein
LDCFYPQEGDWPTLAEALSVHTVAELEVLANAVGVPSAGRKAERIAALCEAVEGDRLRFTFGRLGNLERAAVALAAHSRDGRLSRGGFRLRYASEPDFGTRASWWDGYERPSLLCLFLHGNRIPDDLRARLRELVPPLETPPVRTTWTLPRDAIAIERSTAAARELHEALRLLDALPGSSIGMVLHGDSDGLDLRKRESAWRWILAAGGLVRLRPKGLALNEKGREALDAPLPETLASLWGCWLARGEPDEVHRLPGVHGTRSKNAALTDPAERRVAIAEALSDCPAGDWVPRDAFLDHIRISGRDFRITHARDALRLDVDGRRVPAHALDDDDRFRLLEGPYVLRFLLEIASTLGIVDVAVDEARSELLAFRLTELGRHCLGLTSEPPELTGTGRARLALDDDLRIRADGPLAESERAVLGLFARHEDDGIYRLSRRRVLGSIARRRNLAAFREFLERGSGAPLPRAFVLFLKDCATRGKSLRAKGTAQLYECRDREVGALVADHPSTRSYCHLANETLLVVPDEQDESFRRRLREAGFGIEVRGERGETPED